LLKAGQYSSKALAKLANPECKDGIILPASIYPPSWDKRDEILNKVINAAKLQANTTLTKQKTSTEPDGMGEHYYYLNCFYGRLRCMDAKSKANTPIDSECAPGEIPSANYREGVRLDRLVNKDKSSRGKAGKNGSKRRRAQKPKKAEHCCKFQIRLKLRPGKFWYVPWSKEEFVEHTWHKELPQAQMTTKTNTLTEADRKQTAIVGEFAGGSSSQNIARALNEGDFALTGDQIKGLAKKASDTQDNPSGKKVSNTTKFINRLDRKVEEKKGRYIALYHEVKETSLIWVDKADERDTLRRSKRKKVLEKGDAITKAELKKASELTREELANLAGPLAQEEMKFEYLTRSKAGERKIAEFEVKDLEDKLALGEILQSFRDKLTVGQKILVAAAWAREDEVELFQKFPHVFMFDVTFNTNSEKRPLGVSLGIDGNMNSFSPFRVFMPSRCAWVYNWIFGHVMPNLLGEEVCNRIQIVLTDGEPQMYRAFDQNKRVHYKSAIHQLCMYHLVLKGLERCNLQGLQLLPVMNFMTTFKETVYSWMTVGSIENEKEFLDSKVWLEVWLEGHRTNESQLADICHNAVVLQDFVTKSLLPHKERWLACLRQDHLNLLQCCTSALEGMNHTIKIKSSVPVTPCMSMYQSFVTMDQQSETRLTERKKIAMRKVQSYAPWATGSETVDHVTDTCESEVRKNNRERFCYHARASSQYTIQTLRRRGKDDTPIYCLQCNQDDRFETCLACSDFSPVPRFVRIRTITFTPINGGTHYVVVCSCPYFGTHGIPCRHFCVFSHIQLHHIHVRWRLDYDANFNDRDAHNWREWRAYFQQRMKNNQLVISRSEYDKIMEKARRWTKESEKSLFEEPSSRMYQKKEDGMLMYVDSRQKFTASENILLSSTAFLSGALKGELHLPSLSTADSDSDTDSDFEDAKLPALGPNPYTNIMSMYSAVSEVYEASPDRMATINGDLMTYFGKLLRSARQELGSQESYLGEYVDLYPETEKRKVGVRKRSASEPKRQRKRRRRSVELTFEDSLVS